MRRGTKKTLFSFYAAQTQSASASNERRHDVEKTDYFTIRNMHTSLADYCLSWVVVSLFSFSQCEVFQFTENQSFITFMPGPGFIEGCQGLNCVHFLKWHIQTSTAGAKKAWKKLQYLITNLHFLMPNSMHHNLVACWASAIYRRRESNCLCRVNCQLKACLSLVRTLVKYNGIQRQLHSCKWRKKTISNALATGKANTGKLGRYPR